MGIILSQILYFTHTVPGYLNSRVESCNVEDSDVAIFSASFYTKHEIEIK